MSKKDKVVKTCCVCRKEWDAKKDADKFCEAEDRVACKAHHGIEAWHKEAKEREKKTMTTMTGVMESALTPAPDSPATPA